MLGLGTPAPDFALPDTVSGRTIHLADFGGKQGLPVMFLCPHCP
jgi:peroxiredoxin